MQISYNLSFLNLWHNEILANGVNKGPQNHYGFAINTPAEVSLTPGLSATTESSQCPPPLPFSSSIEFRYSDPGNFTIDINQCSNRTDYFGSLTSPPPYCINDYFWNNETISHQIFDFTCPSLSSVAKTDDLHSISGFSAVDSTAQVYSEQLAMSHSRPANRSQLVHGFILCRLFGGIWCEGGKVNLQLKMSSQRVRYHPILEIPSCLALPKTNIRFPVSR